VALAGERRRLSSLQARGRLTRVAQHRHGRVSDPASALACDVRGVRRRSRRQRDHPGARRRRGQALHPKAGLVLFVSLLLFGGLFAAWIAERVKQLADWTLRLTAVFFFLRAFGILGTVHNVLLVQVSQSLATIFPFSPAGIGTEQALLLYIFRGVASRTSVLSFSVGLRITLIVVNATLGFSAILITLRTLRYRQVVEPDGRAVPKTKGQTP
jgi:hypothetical protein